MKNLLTLTCIFVLFYSCKNPAASPAAGTPVLTKDTSQPRQAAGNPYAPIDLSPLDIAYFPVDYPIKKMALPEMGMPVARVIYSRPHKQGRHIFGSLLKYGEHWRLGANEASEIEFFKDVSIFGKRVPQGRYILYSIPQPDAWTIILNSNIYSWGLKQDSVKDKFRFTVPIEKNQPPLEFYTMVFQKTAAGADLLMAWDDVVARLPLSFSQR